MNEQRGDALAVGAPAAPCGTSARPALTHLIEAEDSILLVIDVQDHFLQRIDAGIAGSVVERVRWLVQVAQWLHVPVIVTAEESTKQGPTTERIRRVFTSGTSDLDKIVFGLAGQANIVEAVEAYERKTAVLVGLETDVCVLHSAFGLARRGYNVVVICDATASPGTGHTCGLERMRAAGLSILSCKGLFYEWMRDLKTVHHFSRESGVLAPTDLIL